ncbi:CPBP family intramembrane glutamic endopeptidase [Levilactobacillus zymae]|uniref:CPBP family intramembrane glutamic endopeptidase n=1 Tax=Levilactobacillus zymae TaxID=267363 RepID=UPI0028BA573C|nr:CPBP family intramembrane glutamic endopeptidase [Levilactobacillus zymae]MDT6981505.1 CPBP family intramembrane glutamic endopeptidase [Levilactobacillus zymae]
MKLRRQGIQILELVVLVLGIMFGVALVSRSLGGGPIGRLLTQDGVLLVVLVAFNRWWLHVPIYFRPTPTFGEQLRINTLPIIWMALLAVALVGSLTVGQPALGVGLTLIIALLVGSCEEYLFRGLILGLCLRLFHLTTLRRVWAAVALSSLLFGATHLVNLTHQGLEPTLVQMLNAFALGVLFAASYLRTRSLVWPILLHFFNDFVAILIGGLSEEARPVGSVLAVGVMVILYCGVAGYLLRRQQLPKVQANFAALAPLER